MLLAQPKNYHVSLRYAELLYSTKRDKLEDMINARKYFMLASITKGRDSKLVRALFGIIKATRAIQKLQTRHQDPNAAQIITSAQEQIREAYAAKGCPKALAALKKMPIMQPPELASPQ